MTEYTRHFISVTSKADRGLADVIFNKRPGLKSYFENTFSIMFDKRVAYGDKIFFTASQDDAEKAQSAFAKLSADYERGAHIDKIAIKEVSTTMSHKHDNAPAAAAVTSSFQKAANQNGATPKQGSGPGFTPKNESQQTLANLIDSNDLTFAIGSAGTGKTYVAVAKAVEALKAGKVKKILLARPAKEAGENIGFLKGDANEKLAPYMRPLYDELEKTFGRAYQNLLTNGTIEIVPVGFMRGRTFTDSFIILDEAQNTTVEQIKMALTRIGEGSKMVVTGDESQIDLENRDKSGLIYAATRLNGREGVGVHAFGPGDVVRSKIVMTVVDALGDENQAPKPLPAPKAEVKAEAPAPAPTVTEAPAAEKPVQKQRGNNPRW